MAGMNAAGRRLREALNEYIASIAGDTGTRRGSVRSQINEEDRAVVQHAQALVQALDGQGGSAAPAGKRDTPGARARDRVASGEAQSSGWNESAQAARSLFGQVGTPAQTPTNEGGAS